MVGDQFVMQESLLYEFRLEAYVPAVHMLCAIDRFVDLSIWGGISRRSTARWADLPSIPN
jgi:hypothetical protein